MMKYVFKIIIIKNMNFFAQIAKNIYVRKTRDHINHNKKIIIEIQPSKKELNIIEGIIKSCDEKINNLEKDKFNKVKEIKNKLKERENKLKEKKEIETKENKTIPRYNYDENIENTNYLKRLNEIIYNTYNVYNNNYYNSININNILINAIKNQTFINEDLKNEYKNIIKIKNEKIKINNNKKDIIFLNFSKKIFSYLIEKKKL